LVAVLGALLGSCSGGGGAGGPAEKSPLPKPLAEQYAIDGVVDLSVFSAVTQTAIDMKDTFGIGSSVGTTTLRYAMVNDERHLYIAMVWSDATPTAFNPYGALTAFDGVVVMFDNDGDVTFAAGEDARRLVMNIYSSSHSDLYNDSSGFGGNDAVGDGLGKMTWSAATGTGTYQAEFLIPLAPDATGQDGVLNATTRFNINILDNIQVLELPAASNVGSLSGLPGMGINMDSSGWPLLPYAVPAPHDQPQMPTNLKGLIAFISDHENPLGELYTFDPATSFVTRVTNSTGLYIDGVSVSHGGTKLAFYGGPSTTDNTTWEIYTVNAIAGSIPTALTTNTILDGHPAWSPDDSEIVYASFRGPGPWQASLVTMTSATGGGEMVLSTVTSTTANDNDPDWLPDGRIVFKTDRFDPGLQDQVRIAVMNRDGTMVTQLTDSIGTSDHDPTATNTVTVFERFTKGTNYSTDLSSIYSPWNIVEARIDGSGERTLLADGWVNWLPVHDPSGEYLVYLKSTGYTDARLMSKDGRDLGRLIPGITRIRYIDWK
jgi:Tol biopolymer transport system component